MNLNGLYPPNAVLAFISRVTFTPFLNLVLATSPLSPNRNEVRDTWQLLFKSQSWISAQVACTQTTFRDQMQHKLRVEWESYVVKTISKYLLFLNARSDTFVNALTLGNAL